MSTHSVDFKDVDKLAEALSADFDSIVCAFGPPLEILEKVYFLCVETHARIKAAYLASNHKGSFVIIGGAGSLHDKDGKFFVDKPSYTWDFWWTSWPNRHLNYMSVRAYDHGMFAFSRFVRLFMWARGNILKPGWFSWILRPFARLYVRMAKKTLCNYQTQGLIYGSRIALHLYEGIEAMSWSFLSPPWYLRDKGIRTGRYEAFVDTPESPAYQGIEGGIYNEDLAVAVVDEVENNKFAFKHWTATGSIDLKEW